MKAGGQSVKMERKQRIENAHNKNVLVFIGLIR